MSALFLLAKHPAEQISYLKDLGVEPSADELALEFEECVELMGTLAENGFISTDALKILNLLNRKLDVMSESSKIKLWEFEGLFEYPEWEEVRDLARRALKKNANQKGPVMPT